ncbi:hypothetical protein [Streptacidiphilus pinicola]|uniref:hypothetical protein n=1 Tax=Streptacidiphilus pinicola TaxID=2219663 RepID=UPI0014023160|nr:hypothetical protein [Streptacidiphilus pinicola]
MEIPLSVKTVLAAVLLSLCCLAGTAAATQGTSEHAQASGVSSTATASTPDDLGWS